MAERFAQADLIVCRSGAITVAEVSASGRAAIFIPFGASTDAHQMRNAEAMQKAGAARLMPQDRIDARATDQRNFLPPGPAPENLGNGRSRALRWRSRAQSRILWTCSKRLLGDGLGHEGHVSQFPAHSSRRHRRERHERNRGSAAFERLRRFGFRLESHCRSPNACEKLGATIHEGHHAASVHGAHVVVISSAVGHNNDGSGRSRTASKFR